MKIALALIVKGSDDEAVLLDRCLDNMLSQGNAIDGVFVTRTNLPGEKPNELVKKVALKYGAIVSDFEWIYDFAAARNFNFSQVPKSFDYILWTDADDAWRGLAKLKAIIAEHPHMDAFGFDYLYAWDEHKLPTVVHRKTMLVKNDDCVEWVGALHEDLMEKRQLDIHVILKDIERCHLSTPERSEANAKRNLTIAAKAVEENPDDPRSYWNLANSQYGVAAYEEARDNYIKFLKASNSDDEKYLAHERISEAYNSLGDRENAVMHLQLAIGLMPNLPDAFFQMAHLYYTYRNLDKAEEYSINGLKRKPQPERMIVFNPRDYDYNPMMLLSRVYYELNRPDMMLTLLEGCLRIYPEDKHLQQIVEEGRIEKKQMEEALIEVQALEKITNKEELSKAMDALPEGIKSHPAVAVIRNKNFIKDTSSGKDLVYYCGQTVHEWNPKLFKEKGFGGSEEAVIHLAKQWAMLGWNVTVYNSCGREPMSETYTFIDEEHVVRNVVVNYKPYWMWNYRDKQDVTILWRWMKPLDAPINTGKLFLDLHDVAPEGELTQGRLSKLDKIFVKTKFHRSLFPNIPDKHFEIVPNGMEVYKPEKKIKKDYNLIINTSSPDRSMDAMPEIFRRVKALHPRMRMQWAYGWHNFEAAHSNDAKKMQWMKDTQKAMDEAGIETLGRLPQHEVGELYHKAAIFSYPTEFAEIDCISVKKAQAAKCYPVTTDFGALAESNVFGLKVHSEKNKDTWAKPYQFHFGIDSEKMIDAYVTALCDAISVSTGDLMPGNWDGLSQWVEDFDWDAIAKRWNNEFNI